MSGAVAVEAVHSSERVRGKPGRPGTRGKPKQPVDEALNVFSCRYTLRMPRGARYYALSGPLGKDIDMELGGLRPFRLEFLTNIDTPATALR